jgi:hypothetical protein
LLPGCGASWLRAMQCSPCERCREPAVRGIACRDRCTHLQRGLTTWLHGRLTARHGCTAGQLGGGASQDYMRGFQGVVVASNDVLVGICVK